MMRTVPVLRTALTGTAVVLALALTGCGSTSSGGPTTSAPGASTPAGGGPTSLTITAQASPDAAAKTWTLTCDPPGGSHPDAAAACAQLAAAEKPFAPLPKNVACTEIYGGPQMATVTGTYRGEPVDASFNRTNGCEIARWDKIATVLVLQGGA